VVQGTRHSEERPFYPRHAMIRSFEDQEGGRWDVTVGRASWGAFYALFVPEGDGETRQALLPVEASDAAARFLGKVDERGMSELFQRSEPRPRD
jgi:hypothetical protein